MSHNEVVSLTFESQVATVEIRREKQLNALNAAVLNGLSEAAREVSRHTAGPDAYADCRVAVIRGAGEKAFVAGADIKEMKAASREELRSFILLGQRVMREIEALPLPVVALVPGFAIGGGLELALACDLIIAGERAQLGQAEVKLGLIPGFGGTQRLVDRVGVGAARRLIYSGDNISAAEALSIGLVDYLAPEPGLAGKLDEILQTLRERSPLALAAAKRAIARHNAPLLHQGLEYEVEEFLGTFRSADASEGLDAFLNKRQPQFRGHYE